MRARDLLNVTVRLNEVTRRLTALPHGLFLLQTEYNASPTVGLADSTPTVEFEATT